MGLYNVWAKRRAEAMREAIWFGNDEVDAQDMSYGIAVFQALFSHPQLADMSVGPLQAAPGTIFRVQTMPEGAEEFVFHLPETFSNEGGPTSTFWTSSGHEESAES